ncbi:MAG: hypothetical protein WD535_04240 [Thermaerobacterales bacterium]
MHFTTHAMTGAGIGALVAQTSPTPVAAAAALAAGLVSHAVLDSIPHKDSSTIPEVVLDVAAGIALVWWAAGSNVHPAMLLGALGGVLPDLEIVLVHFGLMRRKRIMFPSHTGLTPHRINRTAWGLWIQVPFVISGFWLASSWLG